MTIPDGEQVTFRLPAQSPPIRRHEWIEDAYYVESRDVEAAQTVCDDLRGLARQMCYAVEYGVSI